MNEALERRETAFAAFRACLPPHYKLAPLVDRCAIPPALRKRLEDAVFTYMCAGLDYREPIYTHHTLLQEYDACPQPHVTPNGILVPKRNTILEYNLVVRAFAALMKYYGFGHLVQSWHVPLNVRFKSSYIIPGNLDRARPTEFAHSDAWAGESSESVTVHIPLFGDLEHNYLKLYTPDDSFEEGWLKPLPTYKAADPLLSHYKALEERPRAGTVVFADFATLHGSEREMNCGPRVTIDTAFILKKPVMVGRAHSDRVGERARPEVLEGIGENYLFYFPNTVEEWVENKSGFKHPTNLMLVPLPGAGQ